MQKANVKSAEKWYYQNTFNCWVLFQVEQLTVASNSLTCLCVILKHSLVTLPCFSRPIIIARYAKLCKLIWTFCYIHKIWILLQQLNVFNSEKKECLHLVKNFCDLQQLFKICLYKAVLSVEQMDSQVWSLCFQIISLL